MLVIKDVGDEWTGYKFDINLDPSHGLPSVTNIAWINNPQYIMDVNDKNGVNVCFTL